MATSNNDPGDMLSARRLFLEQVAASERPIRARELHVPGLDRRAIQKRLERLRRAAGGPAVGDESVIAYARRELEQLAGPVSRGAARLRALADPAARAFAEVAGVQAPVVGDWVELARSPSDRGWTRDEIRVRELAPSALFIRGRMQSWLSEKKRYLRKHWADVRRDPDLRRAFLPNLLKMDLAGLVAPGTDDSPLCVIDVAPTDWLTSVALNSRLSEQALTSAEGETVRARWGEPSRVAERRALPGMLVAHIVVETTDRRLLVCKRQSSGLQDELGAWSLSIEERWSGRRELDLSADRHPHDVVRRGVEEELGIAVQDDDIRVLAWGIEASVLYPGFVALARTDTPSWQMEDARVQASDPNEIRHVTSIPAESIRLLLTETFAPSDRPELNARWHRTAKARLFAAFAHIQARDHGLGRDALLRELGAQS